MPSVHSVTSQGRKKVGGRGVGVWGHHRKEQRKEFLIIQQTQTSL